MKKADYRKIAGYYDKGRTSADEIISTWMGMITKYVRGKGQTYILDIGCGTGRFSIPMASKLGYRVVGADAYEEMLEKAREKDSNRLIRWERQDIQDMTYPSNTFDAVFMSHVLHHCDSPKKALEECHRILVQEGIIIVRYGAIEHIRDDVEHTFFPETLAIDEARTHSVNKLEKWLDAAGFKDIITEEIIQKSFQTGKAHLESAMIKNTSVLSMISQDAFDCGIKKLEEYVNANPDDPWLLYDKFGFTVGYKRSG